MLNLDGAPVGRFPGRGDRGQASHALGNALSIALTGTMPQPATLFGVEINGSTLDVTAHRFDERTIIEFEPATPLPGPVLGMARTVIGRLRAAETPERLIQQAALLLQAQLGYDQVMVYELGPDSVEARSWPRPSAIVAAFAASISRQATFPGRRGRCICATRSG